MPVGGTGLFVALYMTAARLYPGGSQVDKNSVGFSWIDNYWCNLLNEHAINGQPNPAKPVAVAGLLVLCLTLTCFWFLVARYIATSKKRKRTIQLSGTLSMVTASLLFTAINHDLLTNFASSFGLIATLATFVELYRAKWLGLLMFGLFNMLLVLLNNYLYYSKEMIVYLPVVQKITFAAFLGWMCGVNLRMFHRISKESTNENHRINPNISSSK